VKLGDHISGIAQSFGSDDYNHVWGHPDNADLAAQRTDTLRCSLDSTGLESAAGHGVRSKR
jgi:hypothetical protein